MTCIRYAALGAMALAIAACAPGAAAPVARPALEAARPASTPNLGLGTISIVIDGVKLSGTRQVIGLDHDHLAPDAARVSVSHLAGDPAAPGDGSGRATLLLDHDSAATRALVSWYRTILAGLIVKKSLSVIFVDDGGTESARYVLDGTMPVAVPPPLLTEPARRGRAAGVEQIELSFEQVTRE